MDEPTYASVTEFLSQYPELAAGLATPWDGTGSPVLTDEEHMQLESLILQAEMMVDDFVNCEPCHTDTCSNPRTFPRSVDCCCTSIVGEVADGDTLPSPVQLGQAWQVTSTGTVGGIAVTEGQYIVSKVKRTNVSDSDFEVVDSMPDRACFIPLVVKLSTIKAAFWIYAVNEGVGGFSLSTTTTTTTTDDDCDTCDTGSYSLGPLRIDSGKRSSSTTSSNTSSWYRNCEMEFLCTPLGQQFATGLKPYRCLSTNIR